MASLSDRLRIVGFHKLPFDPEGFEEDMASVANHPPKIIEELRRQCRSTWDNAWLVVVEADGPPDRIDFDGFAHPAPGPNAQAAYMEQTLEYDGQKTRAAFFLHYVQLDRPLYYKEEPVTLPTPSPASRELIQRMAYESPS